MYSRALGRTILACRPAQHPQAPASLWSRAFPAARPQPHHTSRDRFEPAVRPSRLITRQHGDASSSDLAFPTRPAVASRASRPIQALAQRIVAQQPQLISEACIFLAPVNVRFLRVWYSASSDPTVAVVNHTFPSLIPLSQQGWNITPHPKGKLESHLYRICQKRLIRLHYLEISRTHVCIVMYSSAHLVGVSLVYTLAYKTNFKRTTITPYTNYSTFPLAFPLTVPFPCVFLLPPNSTPRIVHSL